MGIQGLWQALEPATKNCSLTQLTAVDGFEQNRRGKRGIVVGVDISEWLWSAGVFQRNHSQAGENPELRVQFYRLARLLRYAMLVIFVFDGKARPSIKRGTTVIAKPHWLTQLTQELLTACRFSWYTAPGEAEAELAKLNQAGIVDVVVTNDSDIFVFGATHVIRTIDPKHDDNQIAIDVYADRVIRAYPALRLTHGDYLLIALLNGGDYDEKGLEGCGIGTAISLSRSGFGTELLEAALEKDEEALEEYLVSWRCRIRFELHTNQGGHLDTKKPALANKLADDFPNPRVVLAYVKPLTSLSHAGAWPVEISDIQSRLPNLMDLASFCHRKFSWDGPTIFRKFESLIWNGMCLRMLIESVKSDYTLSNELVRAREFVRKSMVCIKKAKQCKTPGESLLLYQLEFRTESLVQWSQAGIDETPGFEPVNSISSYWFPRPIVELALPNMLADFHRVPKNTIPTLPPHPETILANLTQETHPTTQSLISQVGSSSQAGPSSQVDAVSIFGEVIDFSKHPDSHNEERSQHLPTPEGTNKGKAREVWIDLTGSDSEVIDLTGSNSSAINRTGSRSVTVIDLTGEESASDT